MGWDSNPRYAFDVYTLSRRAPSTARPPIRTSAPADRGGKRTGKIAEGWGESNPSIALNLALNSAQSFEWFWFC